MNNIDTLEAKFYEYLEYLNQKENKIPSQSSKALFSDQTKMGYYFINNELKMRKWLQERKVDEYPIAERKIRCRIEHIDSHRERFHQRKIRELSEEHGKVLVKK